MSAKAIAVVGAVLVTAVTTIAYFLFEQRRYLTNNPNTTTNDFSTFEDTVCPICRDSMDTNSRSCTLLICGHYIHENCLRDMNNARAAFETNKCPVCRTPFRY